MDESCLYKIRKAGVIGCGGAGFPTHVKLNCHPKYLIVNGMECEPLLATGRYVMRHYAYELVDALYKIGSEIGAEECVISLKETYEPEIAAGTTSGSKRFLASIRRETSRSWCTRPPAMSFPIWTSRSARGAS